jgi:hypothetical protein
MELQRVSMNNPNMVRVHSKFICITPPGLIKVDITKIVLVTLEYKMDLSRLNVIELDNNNKSSVMIIMFSQERNLNSHY